MRTWFITGISRGLGRALTEAAMAKGDTVIGTSRSGNVPDLPVGRGRIHVLPLEIADPTACDVVVAKAYEFTDRIDVVVNNAGHGVFGPIEGITDSEVAHLFEVDFFGPLRLIRAFLPCLRKQGAGHIVNISSIAGRAPMAGSGIYAAAKAAIEGLSMVLAQEVAPLGIMVTVIAPGGFRTDFMSDNSSRRRNEELERIYAGTAGTVLTQLDSVAGRRGGDPALGAEAIVAAIGVEEPPLHLLLGSDALLRARTKLDAMMVEIDRWEELTRGTDFTGAKQG